MNNFTFGNAQHRYYETISGGSGAGSAFDGTGVEMAADDAFVIETPADGGYGTA